MSNLAIDLEDDVIDLMRQGDQTVDQVAKEFIVLELYRRGTLASGRAAELLGMGLVDFIQYSSDLGIPFFDTTDEEWESERRTIESLWSA
jgi:hypothetical protein